MKSRAALKIKMLSYAPLAVALAWTIALCFVAPPDARADQIYSGCDYTQPNTAGSNVHAGAQCNAFSAFDFTGTLGGVSFPIETGTFSGNVYLHIYDRNGGSLSVYTSAYDASTFRVGENTFDLSSYGVNYAPPEIPAVEICTNNSGSCSSANLNAPANGTNAYPYTTSYWYWNAPPPSTTQIIQVIPFAGSLESTTSPTTLETIGYVAATDANPNLELQMLLTSNALSSVPSFPLAPAAAYVAPDAFDFPLGAGSADLFDGFGSFDVSTTTTLPSVGTYYLKVSILNKGTSYLWGLVNLGGYTLVSSTTQFSVGSTTAADRFISSLLDGTSNLLTGTATSTITACDPLDGFNGDQCLIQLTSALFVPDPTDITSIWTSAQQGFFSVIPWGYITLFVGDLSTTTMTDLPQIAYSFPADYPAPLLAGTTWGFDFGSYLAQGSALASSTMSDAAQPENIWEIMMPIVNTIVWLVLAFAIIHDLTGIHGSGGGGGYGADAPNDDSERLKEWEYTHRK